MVTAVLLSMPRPKSGDVQRNVALRLYPSAVQATQMKEWLKLHCELYNAALEERREVWRMNRKSTGYYDQQNQLPEVKAIRPELIPLGSHALQGTLRKLDRSFNAFFRRVKAGEKPGYPRFKSWRRYPGWTYPDYSGWKYIPDANGRNGKLRITNLGHVRARGGSRTQGEPQTCTIMHKRGKWYASIVINRTPERTSGADAIGMDLGCEKFAAFSSGKRIENPRHLNKSLVDIKQAQKSLSRKRNLKSNRRRRAVAKVARLHAKVTNQRKDFLHKESAKLVDKFSVIVTEKLNVKGMSASGGKRKAGLNRSLRDTGMSTFLTMLKYKAEEAGAWVVEVPTQKVKPSQTCPECWVQKKKELSERLHKCDNCGYTEDRDVAAAQVMLKWWQRQQGGDRPGTEGEVTNPMKCETPRVGGFNLNLMLDCVG